MLNNIRLGSCLMLLVLALFTFGCSESPVLPGLECNAEAGQVSLEGATRTVYEGEIISDPQRVEIPSIIRSDMPGLDVFIWCDHLRMGRKLPSDQVSWTDGAVYISGVKTNGNWHYIVVVLK